MAIDTREKRMSVVGVGRPHLRSKLPGTKDVSWRMASGITYGGNAVFNFQSATPSPVRSIRGTDTKVGRDDAADTKIGREDVDDTKVGRGQASDTSIGRADSTLAGLGR